MDLFDAFATSHSNSPSNSPAAPTPLAASSSMSLLVAPDSQVGSQSGSHSGLQADLHTGLQTGSWGESPANLANLANPVTPLVDPEKLLENLNPQQRAAVVHTGSPELIMAGAGSGKTRVLTHRIAYLLVTGQARPGEILAITFTNKAATEMCERVTALVGASARRMWVSTFHSACVRILREHYAAVGLRSTFGIYDQQDSQRLLTMILKDLGIDAKRIKPRFVAGEISNLKNELITPEQHLREGEIDNAQDEAVASCYVEYNKRLRAANAVDFDDLIMLTEQLLRENLAIAENYQRRFRHILVDEYQDTNNAQYHLIRQLMGQGRQIEGLEPSNLTVVGDSDQSIYAFRGATIRNIEEFEKDFPNATTILLEQNYRSTQNILSAANAVIAKNQGRRPKRLWTDSGAGAPIVVDVGDDQIEEARIVVRELDDLAAQGANWGEVAIFYRTNAQSRGLEEMLIKAGIPYRIVGGARFYERQEIKDALAYLQVISNPDDEMSLRRIINTPRRGLGDKAVGALAAHASAYGISLGAAIEDACSPQGRKVMGITPAAAKSLAKFWGMLSELRHLAANGGSPAKILDEVLTRSGYLAGLRASQDPQDASRVENLAELATVVSDFEANFGADFAVNFEEEAEAVRVAAGGVPAGASEAVASTVASVVTNAVEVTEAGSSTVTDQVSSGGTLLAAFLERVALIADADQIPDESNRSGQVTMMTVHTAKGLEFPYVFVTGMEDGTFPHSRSLENAAELAEERRLAYVAITRARKQLFLTRAASRSTWGASQDFPESRFLADIPEELIERRYESERERMRQRFAYDSDFSGYSRARRGRFADGFSGAAYGSTNSPIKPAGIQSSRPIERLGARGSATKPTLELQVGDRVAHGMYGEGRVSALEGKDRSRVVVVEFANCTKRLLVRTAPLKKL